MKYNLNYQIIWHFYNKESKPLNISITNEMFNVCEINAPDGRIGNRYYTYQKPDDLAERLIRHASNENDLIFDPFAGSGTFLIVAAKMNRIAKGCEINKNIIDIALKRGCALE